MPRERRVVTGRLNSAMRPGQRCNPLHQHGVLLAAVVQLQMARLTNKGQGHIFVRVVRAGDIARSCAFLQYVSELAIRTSVRACARVCGLRTPAHVPPTQQPAGSPRPGSPPAAAPHPQAPVEAPPPLPPRFLSHQPQPPPLDEQPPLRRRHPRRDRRARHTWRRRSTSLTPLRPAAASAPPPARRPRAGGRTVLSAAAGPAHQTTPCQP